MKKKTIGIIGGIAPPSTIDYYQKIITGYQNRTKSNHYPAILINSIDMTKMLNLIDRKEFNELIVYLSCEIQKLVSAGADFAVLASNTPHIVFDQLSKKSIIPMISIVDSTAGYAKSLGLKKIGLFGTKSTMQSEFYKTGFNKEKIELITPPLESQDFINKKYFDELVKGIFLEETKNKFIKIAFKMIEHDGIEGLVLGGTELPFILKDEDFINLKLLNTTSIHVDRILDFALNNYSEFNFKEKIN
jgi:aspartate racemase